MDPWRVTQMVTDRKKNSGKTPEKQGAEQSASEPNRINASTPYDFSGKNLTPYGGLLPVITMLEKLGFESLVKETLTSKRIPRAMDLYGFVLSIVLGLYIGFSRLNQLRFIARDPILTGILKVGKLPADHRRSRNGQLILDKAWPLVCASGHHFLAIREWAASECCPAASDGDAQHARTGLGGGQCEADPRYRYDGAYPVWPTDGWAQRVQPEEQGQEEFGWIPLFEVNAPNDGNHRSYQPMLTFI